MVIIPCSPAARGQYVVISAPGLSKELALCEVIVFTELGKYSVFAIIFSVNDISCDIHQTVCL